MPHPQRAGSKPEAQRGGLTARAHTARSGEAGPGARVPGPQFSLSQAPVPSRVCTCVRLCVCVCVHLCVRAPVCACARSCGAHAGHVNTWKVPLGAGGCGLSVQGLFPPKVPLGPAPSRVPEDSHVTDLDHSIQPRPGPLGRAPVARLAGGGTHRGLGHRTQGKAGTLLPVSFLLGPWPGQYLLLCADPAPGQHLAPLSWAPSCPLWVGGTAWLTEPVGVAAATATLRAGFPWKQECRPRCHGD